MGKIQQFEHGAALWSPYLWEWNIYGLEKEDFKSKVY